MKERLQLLNVDERGCALRCPARHEVTTGSGLMQADGYLETTELTTELPVSDLSPCSNQMRITVMLSQEFLPNLNNKFFVQSLMFVL